MGKDRKLVGDDPLALFFRFSAPLSRGDSAERDLIERAVAMSMNTILTISIANPFALSVKLSENAHSITCSPIPIF